MFICVGTMAAISFATKLLTFFITIQTVSPLLLFHVKEAGERNIIASTKRGERQLAIELWKLDGPHSKAKVHKILSHAAA